MANASLLRKSPIRAQGTIEYLGIISIVVIISLVVVGLATEILSSNSSVDKTQSRLFWASQEVAIIEAVAYSNGSGIFVVQNNSADPIQISSFMIDDVEFVVDEEYQTAIALGGIKRIDLNGIPACTQTMRSYKLAIKYSNVVTSLLKSTVTGYLIVDCLENGDVVVTPPGEINFDGSFVAGAIPLSDGDGNWVASGDADSGIILEPVNNKICFGGQACAAYIAREDTNLVFGVS